MSGQLVKNAIAAAASVALLSTAPARDFSFPGCQPTRYSSTDVAKAILNSPYASNALKQNACAFGGISQGESAGNGCAGNGQGTWSSGNTGVLQLANFFLDGSHGVPRMAPAQYASLPLQQQVDIWVQTSGVADMKGSGVSSISNALSSGLTIGGAQPTQGMLAACVQFGPGICAKDLKFMVDNAGQCPTDSNGGVRCKISSCTTANLDGNGQSICSWGRSNQPRIVACNAALGSCGGSAIGSQGDFPSAAPEGAPDIMAA